MQIGLVPYVDTVHNRLTVEIRRGCTRGCRCALCCRPHLATAGADVVWPVSCSAQYGCGALVSCNLHVPAHTAAHAERVPPRTTPVAPATPVPRCNSCAPKLLPAGHAEPVALHLNKMLPHSTAATVVLRSFCQPGMLTRPARDVEPSRVVDAVEHGMRITVSMHSLPVVLCSHCRP